MVDAAVNVLDLLDHPLEILDPSRGAQGSCQSAEAGSALLAAQSMYTLFAGFTLRPRWPRRSGNPTFSPLAFLASISFANSQLNSPY
jgi:hypothetical protein